MCIAIFSEAGKGYPDEEILKRCWKKNQDGAGFAYLTVDDEWHITKGFMTWESFWEAWEKAAFEDSHTVVIHFRLGTSGKEIKTATGAFECDPGCTHPFAVTDIVDTMMETQGTYKQITMHNGVVGVGELDLSDTMVAIRDLLEPLSPYLGDQKVVGVLQEILGGNEKGYGSRWWIADGPTCHLLGKWIQDPESDIWYSKDDYIEDEWEQWTQGGVHPAWNRYGTPSRAATGSRVTEVTVNKDWLAKDFATKKLKVFSWAKWTRANKKRDVCETPTDIISDATATKKGSGGDNIVEVYNSKNKCIALIDGITGETIWDVDGNKKATTEEVADAIVGKEEPINPTKHCIDCGAQVPRSQSNDGLCPYCYAQLWPFDGSDEEFDECPNCYEKSYIIDSTFSEGDSECCRCGCLWWSTIKGRDGIVGWNEDTKIQREASLKSLLKHGSV
jgi:hypothetical protein